MDLVFLLRKEQYVPVSVLFMLLFSVIIYLRMYIKKANTRFTLAPRIAFKVYGPFRQMEHVSKELFLFKLGKSQAPFEIIKVISSFVYLFYVPIISFIFKRQQQL